MIIVFDTEERRIKVFKNVKSVLKDINRDRSPEWTAYTRNDWKEGLAEWTEYILLDTTKGR